MKMLLLDPPEFERKMESFEDCMDRIKNNLSHLNEEAFMLKGSWEGESMEAYLSQYNEELSSLREEIDKMSKIKTDLCLLAKELSEVKRKVGDLING